METWLIVVVIVLGLTALGYGWHRLATRMEARGWIYYRNKRAPRGAGGMAAMDVAAIVQPQIEHVVEEIRSERLRAEQDEAGEDL